MINNKEVLAIIPARQHSKRIANKNIKLLCGRPLIFYTIEAAKKSKYIDRIIVSTDSPEILKIAKQFGAEVPFLRPSNLSADKSPDYPVFLHALTWLKNYEKYTPDIVVHLRPTSPLRTADNIDEAIRLLANSPEADSVRSVTEQKHSPYKMYLMNGGTLKPLLRLRDKKESFNLPSQDLPKVYRHVGYVDVVRPEVILKKKQMSGKVIIPLVINNAMSGLDTLEDWKYYEYIIKQTYDRTRHS